MPKFMNPRFGKLETALVQVNEARARCSVDELALRSIDALREEVLLLMPIRGNADIEAGSRAGRLP